MLSEDKKIKTRAQLKEYLDVELKPYKLHGRQYIAYIFQISERAILRKHTILLRKTEYYLNSGHKLIGELYHARLAKMQNKYAFRIPLNCCGKGFRIVHVSPVGVNDNSTVGENCRINICAYLLGDDNGMGATLGDNVIIGSGAKIVGGVTLADNITVGAGAVVTKSFDEPGVTLAGVPAKIIGRKHHMF